MISIFDDDGDRLSITWNGIEFNDPTVNRDETEGNIVHSVAFSTPINFASEPIDDIVKSGGGIEYMNPRIGTRVLSLRGTLKAATESALMLRIRNMQEAFHPLYLQTEKATNRAGTQVWPPPSGMPEWVRALPLKFTRVLPRTWSPTAVPTGKLLAQYHVVPLALPDPVRADHLQGIGAEYTAEFVIMNGGRSFSQTETSLVGNGTVTWTWGQAAVWPVIQFGLSGAGAANLTITTSGAGTPMDTALVLNVSSISSGTVIVDTDTRSIYHNGTLTPSLYSSGDFPILYGGGATTVAWTNTTNVTASSNVLKYRESDWM